MILNNVLAKDGYYMQYQTSNNLKELDIVCIVSSMFFQRRSSVPTSSMQLFPVIINTNIIKGMNQTLIYLSNNFSIHYLQHQREFFLHSTLKLYYAKSKYYKTLQLAQKYPYFDIQILVQTIFNPPKTINMDDMKNIYPRA